MLIFAFREAVKVGRNFLDLMRIMNVLNVTTKNRQWWDIILWWEARRLPYNIIMLFVGLLSFCISYMTIPLVYIIIALLLNAVYTIGWVFELLVIRQLKNENIKAKYPRYALVSYLTLSILFVLVISVYPLLWRL